MQTLADVRGSVERFLTEASTCAKKECGHSCLLTLFPVMLGLAEAMCKGGGDNKELLTWFISEMSDTASWLVRPSSASPTKESVGEFLKQVRDSLAHQCSLPLNAHLDNNIESAKATSARNPDKYVIGTSDLTQAVRETAIRIIEANPNVVFDPDQKSRGYDRGTSNRLPPADRRLEVSATGTSATGPSGSAAGPSGAKSPTGDA
jgi:hypothetical protein